MIDDALRLNPFPPQVYHWYRALALYSAEAYADTVGALREMQNLGSWYWGHGLIAACYAQLGQMVEAGAALDAFLERRRVTLEARGRTVPAATISSLRARADRYRNEHDRDHFLVGFRKAGLPE